METIEVKIKDRAFEYAGKQYECSMAVVYDKEQIIREAESSHKNEFAAYDKYSLKPSNVRLFLDNNNNPIFGMILYTITNTKGKYNRIACGNYYPIHSDLLMLLPHIYQASICW